VKAREDSAKMSRLKKLISSSGLDAILLQLPENVCYVSDYWPLLGLTFVLVPAEGDPVFVHNNFETEASTWIKDVRKAVVESPGETVDAFGNVMDIIRDALESRKMSTPKVGFEGAFGQAGTGYLKYRVNTVSPAYMAVLRKKVPGAEWVDASSLIYESRMIKTKKEIEKLKIANETSGIGLETLYEGCEDGITELALANRIESETILKGTGHKGAEHVMACAFLSSGAFTAETYGVCYGNSSRQLRRGDFVMLEYDVVVDGYTSDMSRTYVVGTPDKEQWKLLRAVHEAQTEGVRTEKDGLPAKEVCIKADAIIVKAGFGKYLRHYFGHGVGVTIWEPRPYIHSKSKDVLRSGMVHSAEPGAYVPGFGGVRIEDNIYLGDDGPTYLSTYMPIQE
jgi:Xaa-Pro aminopeptidase